ncbi:MAG: ABC transporter ATP-binding protein [Rhabdochlamydiaceae bacterium]|nr:ABC transporter ATP-binding protein [Candidatus Amphrikana amoebophyrae]
MIKFEHVHFSYTHTPILNDLSFEIAKGEFIGIVGPNGGGKTTLLRNLMGLLTPTKGKVLLDGKSPKENRTCIGYVPQTCNFDSDFPITTYELVLMGCTSHLNIWGRYSKEAKILADNALKKMGLFHKKDESFGKLSGGQARRALIARALVNSPTVLILDEPTANIDMEAESSICNLLISLKKEMTILMVTHEIPGIIPHVDRVFCIQNSLTIIPPEEVCKHIALGVYHKPKETEKDKNIEDSND